MSLADLLRDKRESSNLTQEYIAEKTGVSTVSVSGWENGKQPKKENIPKIIKAYGLTEKEIGHEIIKDMLDEKKKLIAEQKPSFSSMLFPNADIPYVENLTFNAEETNLIRTICIAPVNGKYPDWSLGDRFRYDPTVLGPICQEECISASRMNRTAHGIWLKLNDENRREPNIQIIEFITRYLMEDPDGIDEDTFSISDLSAKNLVQFAGIIFAVIDRTCEYSTAWIPDMKGLVRIVESVERGKCNAAKFIKDNQLLYNQDMKPGCWLFGGKITKEWIINNEPDIEYDRSIIDEKAMRLTAKGKDLVAYIKQNKNLFNNILKGE